MKSDGDLILQDIDLDGEEEVLSNFSNKVLSYKLELSEGKWNVIEKEILTCDERIESIFLSDIDGDSVQDLLVSKANGMLQINFGAREASGLVFSKRSVCGRIPAVRSDHLAVRNVFDVDGNGLPDLVFRDGFIRVSQGGKLPSHQKVEMDRVVATLDVNGDEYEDVLGVFDGKYFVYLGGREGLKRIGEGIKLPLQGFPQVVKPRGEENPYIVHGDQGGLLVSEIKSSAILSEPEKLTLEDFGTIRVQRIQKLQFSTNSKAEKRDGKILCMAAPYRGLVALVLLEMKSSSEILTKWYRYDVDKAVKTAETVFFVDLNDRA